MRKISKPTHSPEEVFLKCISQVRSRDLKNRLENCSGMVADAAIEFDEKFTNSQIHTILPELLVNGNVEAPDFVKVYDRMLQRTNPGRDIYDEIFMSSPDGLCPICSQRTVTTLDHYLPKTLYPRLTVVPINLVPSCSECNFKKLQITPDRFEDSLLHPYYDDVEAIPWLKMEVYHYSPPVFIFSINNENIPETFRERLINHFDNYSLGGLYSTHSAVEFSQICEYLVTLHAIGGKDTVSAFLNNLSNSRSRNNRNSWQSIFYKYTAEDDWFCDLCFL